MKFPLIHIFFVINMSFYAQHDKTIPKKSLNSNTGSKQSVTLQSKQSESKLTNLGIGVGITRSVIFLSRNILEFNDASGLNICAVYGGNKLVRLTTEYHRFNSINIAPTWYDIKARTYDVNVQFLARFKKNKDLIYPITGISINEFKGFFTGRDDFQNLREKFKINSEVKSYWIGLNFGLGYEHSFGPVNTYIVYKMRVGAQDVNERLNIMDVCYSLGLRYDIKVLKPRFLMKRIYRSYNNRYLLDV